MATDEKDPRLEELQEEIDTIRRRLPDNPGLDIPDPDIEPVYPDPDDESEETPPTGTV